MAKETASLRDLSDDDLVQRLAEAREELFNLRFQNVTGQLDNSSRLGHIRRQVARLNTLLREREIAAAEALAQAAESNRNEKADANG
jgi:large subunit ribosomal protein L29